MWMGGKINSFIVGGAFGVMSNENMLNMIDVNTKEEEFQLQVYASTRQEEMMAWGWDATQQEVFLRMQFRMQQQSYRLQYPDANYKIIRFKEKPTGHALIVDREEEIILADLALMPEFRNLGIGTRIIERLQMEARQRCKVIRLHVLQTNEAARRLYERLGFQATGQNSMHIEMKWKECKSERE